MTAPSMNRRSLARVLVASSRPIAFALVGGALGLCWIAGIVLSHTSLTPRYWFFFPIMLGAARFGRRGALVTALISGAIAMSLPSGVPQTHNQIVGAGVSRAIFFIVMGQVLAALFAVALSEARDQGETMRAASAIAVALHRGEFIVWYQPIVELATTRVVGAEALVRWNHPTRGLLAPAEFIETAEDSGIIIALGAHVLETACRQLALWRASVLADTDTFKLAVNISAYQLSTPDLVIQVERMLRETGMPASWLNLEITETAAIVDIDETARKVGQLRALGIRIAIDDFGIGHTSLRHLQHLDVDVVKIDQSFVATLGNDGNRDIAAAVIALARTLGMTAIAEGVETPRQAKLLRELGAELAQGYLFGRPQPAAALTELLRAQPTLAPRVPRMLPAPASTRNL